MNLDFTDIRSLQKLHNATLEILEKTGMRVDCTDFHDSLASIGAKIDRSSRVVRFPARIIEDMIEYLRKQIKSGKRQYLLNGVTNPRWTPPLGPKFGGACIEYLDFEKDIVRQPTEKDLIQLLQLGEALESIGFVGNPVACLVDVDGNPVPGYMQRVKTASVVAKYTTKCGSTEVWNEKELDLLIEIGQIVRGGRLEYLSRPCFVTAKETITPLQFPSEDGKVLLMLARRGLPCTIIPMPLSGATCPCTVAANIVMANAEILGAMACLHAAVPEAMLGGGIISGSIDMKFNSASFSAPEVLLQDAGLAQLYDEYYGQDLAIGTGYIDAKYPGAQALSEKTFKMLAAARQKRFNYPVGLLAGGKRFSAEQALLELEVADSISRYSGGFEVNEETLALQVIQEVGIGKEYLSHEHTLLNFEANLWIPELADRSLPGGSPHEKERDMIHVAHKKVKAILDHPCLYVIDDIRAKAIDDIVEKAKKILIEK